MLTNKTIAINPGEIHLWFADDTQHYDDQLLTQYHNLLNKEERLQQQRFHFEKHRRQYLITRALIRTVLSLYISEIFPEQWKFTKNDYGKPFISSALAVRPLQFNLSHTEKMIVLAITAEKAVGVDVEYLLRSGGNVEIAERFFSPSETKQLISLPEEKQKNRFFDLWTLKEAYIKACGMGLSIPLDHFSYAFSRQQVSKQEEISIAFSPERNDQPEFWQFWQIAPNDTHKVSMAIKDESINKLYSISMRNIVPLAEITEINYPIVMKSPDLYP